MAEVASLEAQRGSLEEMALSWVLRMEEALADPARSLPSRDPPLQVHVAWREAQVSPSFQSPSHLTTSP